MKLNKKGQALVEFIIILPIFIFLAFMIVDYGMICYNKNKMENVLSNVDNMYKNNETTEEIEKFIKKNDSYLNIEIKNTGKYGEIKLTRKYNFITPGLSKMMNNYEIKTERTIYNNE